jgi:hypothetical protein
VTRPYCRALYMCAGALPIAKACRRRSTSCACRPTAVWSTGNHVPNVSWSSDSSRNLSTRAALIVRSLERNPESRCTRRFAGSTEQNTFVSSCQISSGFAACSANPSPKGNRCAALVNSSASTSLRTTWSIANRLPRSRISSTDFSHFSFVSPVFSWTSSRSTA